MESNGVRHQLVDLDRLRVRTLTEGRRLPPWSFWVLALGATITLGAVAIGDGSSTSIIVAAAAWNLIVWGWNFMTSRGRRVCPADEAVWLRTRAGVVVTVLANAALWLGFYFFGVTTLLVLGGAYVAYLLYIAIGDARQAARR